MLKDAKYLIAYTAPLTAFIAVAGHGIWTYATVILTFVIIPSLEFFTFNSTTNFTPKEEKNKTTAFFFDMLLYLNIPLLLRLIWCYFSVLQSADLQLFEIIGMTLSVGIVVGGVGINVAHELGHRHTWYEELMAKVLLVSALYMHFFIEHNRGHHKNVATDEDPASSRLGEPIYIFWIRSVFGGYWNAWKLEKARLTKTGKNVWGLQNQMIWFQAIQVSYLLAIGFFFGWQMIGFAIAIAINGFLLLESVNYIEHYGLRRKKLDNGRYEKVQPIHSWNSNHEVGRIFLYELTRHSDHHFKASRKYQVLRHFDESPQLPLGYPGSILMALVPPLWFKVMNPLVRTVEG